MCPSASPPSVPARHGRWILVALAGITVIVVGLAGLTVELDRQGRRASAAAAARLLSGALAQGLGAYLDRIDLELRDLADPRLNPPGQHWTPALVERHRRHLPGVVAIELFDAAGRPVPGARAGAALAPEREAVAQAFFAELRDGPAPALVVSSPLWDGASGQRVVLAGRRLTRPDGSFAGVVRAALPAQVLVERFLPDPAAPGLHVSLLNQRVEFLARRPAVAAVLGGTVSTAASPPLRALIERGAEEGSYRAVSQLDGQSRIAFLRRAAGHPLYFSVGIAEETFLDAWRGELARVAVVVGAFLLLVGLLLSAWRQRGRALAALAEAHRAVQAQADRFDRVLRGANDGWWDWDLGRDEVEYSPRWWEMLGEPAEARRGPSHLWRERVHPDDRARVEAELAAAWAGDGATVQTEFRLRHRSGRTLPVLARSFLLRDDRGRVTRMAGTTTDLSSIRAVEARLRAMFDLSPLGCCLCDGDGRILDANPALLALLGGDRAGTVGRVLPGLVPRPDSGGEEGAQAARLAAEGRFGPYESALTLADGRAVPVRLRGVRLAATEEEDAAREGEAIYALVEDVSAQRAMLRALEERTRELARSNADLEQFAYVASHDLREPLRMVSSFLGLLERRHGEGFDDEARQFVAFAKDGAQRMDRLILDLLDFSRIGREDLALAPVRLRAAIEQAAANLAVGLAESGARLEIDPGLDAATVRGDAGQLASLFQNLIGNAIKYRSPDRPPVVTLSARRVEGWWQVGVADNGIGIEPDYYERIFRLFQRLHSRERYDGTGIGLALCKKIVERHGGRIWVESRPGEGSRFLFTLPAPGGG
ncbi:MAG: hypothetical protein RLZZ501_1045 [Pseudomonadota bacterium]